MKISSELADQLANAYVNELNGGVGGRLYIFSGTIPESADDALDMMNDHTELVVLTNNDTGGVITWTNSGGGVILKTIGEVWEGTNAFDGAYYGPGTQTATFARFCADGDNGRDQSSGNPRIQFCISGPTGTACELLLSNPDVTDDGGTMKTRIDFARIVVPLG